MSDDPAALHNRARSLYQANRLQEALFVYRRLCRLSPDDAQAWHMAGAILGMLGELESARICCEKVIGLTPDAHGPYVNLGGIHLANGDYIEARRCFMQALSLKPGDAQTLVNLGSLYIKLQRLDDAENCLQHALVSEPHNCEAHNNLGTVHHSSGKLDAAEKHFRHALELCPDFVDAYANLGALFSDRLEFDRASDCYMEGLRHAPGSKSLLFHLGKLHQTTGRFEAAVACYRQALDESPDDAKLLAALASVYERRGKHGLARSTIEPLIRSGHRDVDAILTYSALCKADRQYSEALRLLESLLQSPQDRNDEVNILYSLGELYDEINEYDSAFEHFRKANELDRMDTETPSTDSDFSTLREYFREGAFAGFPRARNNSDLPVFIVGMPRSGTSLVEQILATHPDVAPGGERGDIIHIVDALGTRIGTSAAYPFSLDIITADVLDRIADDYLRLIGSRSGNHIRFTDKTPLHGMHLGLINLLLPESRVIVCNRSPLDTCLSVYFHRFNRYHNYANDLRKLGNYFCGYQQLLRHWAGILDMRLLQIQYEDLVKDSETIIRNILEFCGLDWNRDCLDFHRNLRTVNTPSYAQVRKPLYSSSIHRWKHYEKHIGPLIDALDCMAAT